MMKLSIKELVLAPLLTLLFCMLANVSSAPLPPRRQINYPAPLYRNAPRPVEFSSSPTQYERLYRSIVEPLELYLDSPHEYANVYGVHGNTPINHYDIENYVHAVNNHPAYISPRSHRQLDGAVNQMVELLARHDAPTPIEQRRFLAKFEDVARQATTDIQTALHPENAAAQHAVAVEQLLNKYKTMSDWLKTNNNIDKLTNHLDESMQDRFLRAVDVTDAAERLLGVIKRQYAARFPPI